MADSKTGRMTDAEAAEALEKDPRAKELLELLTRQDSERVDALMEMLSEMEGETDDEEQ